MMTVRDAVMERREADFRMMLRDRKRQSQQHKTYEQAAAAAKQMGSQFGVLCRNGAYIIYDSTAC